MEIFALSELVGKEIASVRYTYNPRNEYDLQEFHAYLKLSNGIIIDIPVFDQEEMLVLTEENKSYFQKCFDCGEKLSGFAKEKIEGQRIEDLYFTYYEGKLEEDQRAYLKLANGYYITENNYGPPGLTTIDLLIYTENDFMDLKKGLPAGSIIKSYSNELKKGL